MLSRDVWNSPLLAQNSRKRRTPGSGSVDASSSPLCISGDGDDAAAQSIESGGDCEDERAEGPE